MAGDGSIKILGFRAVDFRVVGNRGESQRNHF